MREPKSAVSVEEPVGRLSVKRLDIEAAWSHSRRIHAVAVRADQELMMKRLVSREALRVGINGLGTNKCKPPFSSYKLSNYITMSFYREKVNNVQTIVQSQLSTLEVLENKTHIIKPE